MTKKREKREKS